MTGAGACAAGREPSAADVGGIITRLMPKALDPAVTAGDIFFELERFELEDSDRLRVSGRWFGVRGRRFVRPTLTPVGDGERSRVLADLEHKPWAAEDGEPWEAAFPWPDGDAVLKSELSVAPDITIQLPAPGAKGRRPRKLAALPRRDAMTTAWVQPRQDDEGDAQEPDVGEALTEEAPSESTPTKTVGDAELEATKAELDTVKAELDGIRAELDGTRRELEMARSERDAARSERDAARSERDAARSELVAAHRELDDRCRELEALSGQLEAAVVGRDAALSDLEQTVASRDAALAARDGLAAGRERDTQTRGQLTAERDQTQQALRRVESELEDARAALERAARERDEAVTARGAALVMRGATRAFPAYDRHAGWWRRLLALLVLLGVAFALLIVLHVL